MDKYIPFFYESIEIPLEPGDSFKHGKFKNKTSIYKSHYFDDKGDLVIVTDTGAEIKGCKIRLIKESTNVKFNFKDLGRDDWNKVLKDSDFVTEIEYMSPKEFLDRSDYKRFNYDAEKILKIKNSVNKNTTLPIPSLWFDSEWHKNSKHTSSFHDGQHRVLALQELGIEEIPVMIVWNKESKLTEEHFTPFKAWYFPDKDEFIKFSPHKDHREFVDNQMIALRSGAVRIYAFDNGVGVETRNLPDNSLYVKVLKTLSKKISNFKQAIKHIDWFSAGDRKVFNLQEDLHLSDFVKHAGVSGFTSTFMKDRQKIKGAGNVSAKLKSMKVNRKQDYVTFTFISKPTYANKTKAVDPNTLTFKNARVYEQHIRLCDFFKYAETKPGYEQSEMTWKEIKEILQVCPIKVWCNCGSYEFQGMNYIDTLFDAAIYPEFRAPKRWNAYHNDDNFACKHLDILFTSGINLFLQNMTSMINKYIKSKK